MSDNLLLLIVYYVGLTNGLLLGWALCLETNKLSE